jgi:hypothetical protein
MSHGYAGRENRLLSKEAFSVDLEQNKCCQLKEGKNN